MIYRVTANDNKWYKEWQLVATSGAKSDNEWQQVTTTGSKWQRVVILVNVLFTSNALIRLSEKRKGFISLHQKLMQTVVADVLKVYSRVVARCTTCMSLHRRSKIIMQEIPSTDYCALWNAKWHQSSLHSFHTKQSVLYFRFTHFRYTTSDFKLMRDLQEHRLN